MIEITIITQKLDGKICEFLKKNYKYLDKQDQMLECLKIFYFIYTASEFL